MQYKMYDTVLVQEPKGIVPLYLVHLLGNNTVFLECARAHFPAGSWFVCAVHDAQSNSEESP